MEDVYAPASPRSGRMRWVLAGLVALVFAGGFWYLAGSKGPRKESDVPLLRAEDTATKVRPEQPGGMTIPNQDKLVYGGGAKPRVEKLLPPP
jgi:hypothetical protein